MRLGAKIFGALSGVFLLYLLVGLLLPGTWKAEAETVFSAPPSSVFPFLDRMDRWVLWNPMPESGTLVVGPPSGVGAGIDWDDPQYGVGDVRIRTSVENERVEYEVHIEGGNLRIHGSMVLAAEDGGTRLRWTEEGDFGWNPLMGYAARGMEGSQSEAMRLNLETLRALLDAG